MTEFHHVLKADFSQASKSFMPAGINLRQEKFGRIAEKFIIFVHLQISNVIDLTTVTAETTAIITAMATITDIIPILMRPEQFEGISIPSPDEGGTNETSNDSDNGFSGADHHTP